MHSFRAVLATFVLGLTPAVAAASPGGGSIGPDVENATFLLAGINVGIVTGGGWLVGSEVSVAHIWELGWLGGYADFVLDGKRDQPRTSAGFEIGYSTLGIDVGPVFELGGDSRIGLRFRPAITLGAISLCGGPVIPLSGGGGAWGEGSLLLKFPFQ